MDSLEDVNLDYQRDIENERAPLTTINVINSYNHYQKKESSIKHYKCYLKILYVIIFILMFFVLFQNILKYITNIDFGYPSIYQQEKEKAKKKEKLIEIKNENITDNSMVLQNDQNNNKIKSIGFLYSSLFGNGIGRFMTVTGEYLVRKGYDVYFFTKKPYIKDFKFNEKIKRIYAYENHTLLTETLKSGIIDFLIINNNFDVNTIEYYKSLGVKVIGIYHGVFISAMFNNATLFYRNWKNLEHLDAYIHIAADDYYFYHNFGFKRNIFIPNLYTFESSESPSSNLTNHNIMMLGRLNDPKKGVIFALKAMYYIIKEVPDAKLNLVSSDSRIEEFKNMSRDLNLTNNVNFLSYVEKISNYFLDSSVFFFTSLTEAFPMALNEAKAYGLPCVAFDISYSLPFQSGVIKVDMFDYKALARETIKLLKDYDYRIKMGREAKISLNMFTNENTINLWGRLFNALQSGEEDFQKLRTEIENKYYNPEIAEKHMEKQFENLKMYNKIFRCHTIKNFTNLDYINNIEECKNVDRLKIKKKM